TVTPRLGCSAGGHPIFDVVGDLFADLRQLEKLGLDRRLLRPFGELPVLARLLAQIIVVMHVTPSSTSPMTKGTRHPDTHQYGPPLDLPDLIGHAVVPPSTGRAAPVTNEASSESKKSAALAISSGRPGRPIGFWPARWRTSSSGSRPRVLCWS